MTLSPTQRADDAIAFVTEIANGSGRVDAVKFRNVLFARYARDVEHGPARIVLLALARALVAYVAAYEVATKLRADYVAIKADDGPEAGATKGAAYVAAGATVMFNRAALEVRACRYALDHGYRLGAARAALAAEELEETVEDVTADTMI